MRVAQRKESIYLFQDKPQKIREEFNLQMMEDEEAEA